MAADTEQQTCTESARKRRKVDAKLLVNDKVEVRSVEKGFLGSWHSATVIACEYLVRHVQYDNLLRDDNSENVIHSVGVTPVIEGILSANSVASKCRTLIRPLPPILDFGKGCLHYAQCVDVHYHEAWWEGVIFDHKDDSQKRKIFFPDMGDVIEFEIERLRITQDWDELTEAWMPRGNWLFLDLIEEFEQQCPFVVSVRQIWYDVQQNQGFMKLKEWTSCLRDHWKNLILQVIHDYFKLTLMDFFVGLGTLEASSLLINNLNDASVPLLTNDLNNVSVHPIKKDLDDLTCDMEADNDVNVPLLTSDLNNASVHPIEDEIDWDDLISDMEVDNDVSVPLLTNDLNNSSVLPVEEIDWDDISAMEENRLDMNILSSSKVPCHPEMPCVQLPTLSALPSNPNEFSSISSNTNHKGYSSTTSTQRESVKWLPADHRLVPGAEFCPDAVTIYKDCKTSKKGVSIDLMMNVRKHLAYLGWKIEVLKDKCQTRLRYTSPDGKCYLSLFKVCQDLSVPGLEILSLVSKDNKRCSSTSADGLNSSLLVEGPQMRKVAPVVRALGSVDVESEYCPQAVVDYYSSISQDDHYYRSKDDEIKELRCKAKKHLSAAGWSFWYIAKGGKRELRYTSPRGKVYISLRTACKGCLDEAEFDTSASTCRPRQKKTVSMQYDCDGDVPECRVLQSSKRARQVTIPSSSHHPRSVLSLLIDNNVVLPSEKVQYCGRKDRYPMAEGWITREGIKCSCCDNIFTISKFEAHAGSTHHRPSANIFLEDGRSLLDCQLQLKRDNNLGIFRTKPHKMKDRRHPSTNESNDCICSVCHFGGELLLCDQCPSSFHTTCLGLKDVPDGDWFCPSCCCGICGQSRFSKDTDQFNDNSVLNCDQCEHQFHVGCLRKGGLMKLDNYPKGNWFCNKRCEQIFLGLHRLLGKPVPVGEDNLTWTLLKNMKCHSDHDASDNEALMENYSKLNVALGVMHECFEPVKESHMRRDLVEDVIFSKRSELKRLNFQGFYTVLLARDDDLITVATVRVHGEKVAEVPLVGTRFQYRQLGMCRILMNELEKKLMELGVERLVLPAVPGVLNTWTSTFGFLKMTAYERLNFLDYTFLNFQGTILCQKLLMKIPSTESKLLKGTQQEFHEDINGSDNIDLNGNSAVSEVFQADQIGEIVDQGPVDIAGC